MTVRHSIFDSLNNSPAPSPTSWAGRHPPRVTAAWCHAALEAQAARTARAMIKERAGAYALRPRELDAIAHGLSVLWPHHMVKRLEFLKIHPSVPPNNRWLGVGGEIPAINLRGALLYARYSRRFANRGARKSS